MGQYYTEAQKQATYKYLQKHKYKALRLPIEDMKELEKKIEKAGYESFNQFLKDAIDCYLEKLGI